MIDPFERCPRCDLPYKRYVPAPNAPKEFDHLTCSNDDCSFTYNDDPLTSREFQLTLKGECIRYFIFWIVDGTTRVSPDTYFDPRYPRSKPVTFDHWIPFDVTVQQLKIYLTFS